MLERYGHGGDWTTAEEVFGKPKTPWMDFSANMNPLGPPPAVRQIIENYASEIMRYPDPGVRSLKRKLAEVYDIPHESILIGNGAAECIDLITRYFQPHQAAVTSPTFSEYEDALRKVNAKVRHIPLHASHQFQLQRADIQELRQSIDLWMLGHPNNPTGQLLDQELIQELREESKGQLVLDEAFMDFIQEEQQYSLIKEATRDPKLVVIRSMTKFYSIPGIRIGFAVAHPQHISRLHSLQVPWSVNSLAQFIGERVLDEKIFQAKSVQWLISERTWMFEQLRQLNLVPNPSVTNYILFRFPEDSPWTASLAQKHLAKKGILIRDASIFHGLTPHYCRTAIRKREDNARLIEALRELIESEPEEKQNEKL